MIIRSGDQNIHKKIKENKQNEKIKRGPVLLSKDIYKRERWKNHNIARTWGKLEMMGNFNKHNAIELGPYNNINGVWKDEPCFVIAGGPSLRGFDLHQLDGLHTIGINHLIEDYDGFEWFLFLDDRFLRITTYDITKYQGKIFSSNKCRLLPHNNNVRFRALGTSHAIEERIEQGLWNGRMSGLCALHLAIISGADPIYLLGCDCGGGKATDYHYKEDYTGAQKSEQKRIKYVNNAPFYDRFEKWKDRIINLSAISNITTFKKMRFEDIPKKHKKRKIKVIKQNPVICHVQVLKNIEEMGDITRAVYNKTIGKHTYCNINSKPPKADVYILECFINGHEKFRNWKRPYKNSKIISLIHSCGRCMPSIDSDEVVTITYSWKGIMQQKNIDSRMIYAGIDCSIFDLEKNYDKKTFGRITRYSRGKVHPQWGNIVNNILDKYADSECHIISNNYPPVNRDRLYIYRDVKINEDDKKAKYLQKINIFADAHYTFQETFSLCLLQAMASGCAIVLLRGQSAMQEIIGKSGYVCAGIPEFQNTIISLFENKEKMKEMGLKAKERAKEFSLDRMINKWNTLLIDLLSEK